ELHPPPAGAPDSGVGPADRRQDRGRPGASGRGPSAGGLPGGRGRSGGGLRGEGGRSSASGGRPEKRILAPGGLGEREPRPLAAGYDPAGGGGPAPGRGYPLGQVWR